MSDNQTQHIINISDMNPDWNWLANEIDKTELEWFHFSSQSIKLPNWLPKKDSLKRLINAKRVTKFVKNKQAILVPHGPRPAFYTGLSNAKGSAHQKSLAYSFNFSTLPKGKQHQLMSKAYQNIDRFTVFSTMEKQLYADYFDIDESKIDMLHWSVHAPDINHIEAPITKGAYICAVGSQGRDYSVLIDAMRKIRHINLVIVANPASIEGIDIPDNVTVHTNIPLTQAHNIIFHSKFMVVPLRDSEVPCGHVTIVSGMFFKKAMLVTDSRGIHDYITHNQTGKLFNPKDVQALVNEIETLWSSPTEMAMLSNHAYSFALDNCTEQNVISYFNDFLSKHT